MYNDEQKKINKFKTKVIVRGVIKFHQWLIDLIPY